MLKKVLISVIRCRMLLGIRKKLDRNLEYHTVACFHKNVFEAVNRIVESSDCHLI